MGQENRVASARLARLSRLVPERCRRLNGLPGGPDPQFAVRYFGEVVQFQWSAIGK